MKKIYFLLGFVLSVGMLYSQTTNVIFNEDFGKSTTRIGSQYVPQSGNDNNLEKFDSHGSSFYHLADQYFQIAPNPSKTSRATSNQDVWNIDNGYYAVIAPKNIYDFTTDAPDGNNFWKGSWWQKIQNHTDTSDDGAVLVVNGGKVLNQYYRRVVVLEPGKTYKISAWFYGSGRNNVGVNFEAQNITTEEILGSSNKDLGITNFYDGSNNVMRLTEANKWEQKSWSFKVPDSKTCSTIAIALRNNVIADGGNDFYVDDIVLEETTDEANVIDCSDSPEIDAVIKANDDSFIVTSTNRTFNIISNDTYNEELDKIILSGTNKNTTIATIDNWPEGITLNPETGEITVTEGATIPTEPLRYQVCNTLGVCSTALITLKFSFDTTTCTQNPIIGTPKGYTNVGISSYSQNDNFPSNIANGFLALQSSNKGLVISRTTSSQILKPLEGMIIYDTTDKCVKLYNGSTWSCIKKSCNN